MQRSEGKYNDEKSADTDIDYLLLFFSKQDMKYCFYCKKLFSHERHPRPEMTPAAQKCNCPLLQHVWLLPRPVRDEG